MNYIVHLNAFLEKAEGDDALTPYHRSLYMTLFRMWNKTGFKPTFTINRDELMRKANIGSKATYYRCIKYLETAGYLQYHTPGAKYLPSMVTMKSMCIKSDTAHVPEIGPICPENETAQVSHVGHFPKHSHKDLSNLSSNPGSKINGPTLHEVHLFFQPYECTSFTPTSFWYHYGTANWHCDGKPIRNWKALARKWLEKAATDKLKNATHEQPDANTDTDYQKPF